MTDEEANAIAGKVWDAHCQTEDGQLREPGLFSDMVKAGYQAAIWATRKKFTELEDNYDDADSVYFLWRWLDEQVKKEGA